MWLIMADQHGYLNADGHFDAIASRGVVSNTYPYDRPRDQIRISKENIGLFYLPLRNLYEQSNLHTIPAQWMLYSQDQLHSGPYSPVSLAASDITTLLPCDESDFALGREPQSRAALQDTPPAVENPGLICDLHRSLFASLLQAHHFWGIVRRRAVNLARSSAPWDPTSKFALMDNQLRDWEHGLPHEHVWNSFALKRYQAEGQELVRFRLGADGDQSDKADY